MLCQSVRACGLVVFRLSRAELRSDERNILPLSSETLAPGFCLQPVSLVAYYDEKHFDWREREREREREERERGHTPESLKEREHTQLGGGDAEKGSDSGG